MLAVIVVLHGVGWGLAVYALLHAHMPLFTTGIALTAYALGMRHAFDADHLAAIDNATRQLIAAHRPSQPTGFFFSLGHSTVVLVAGGGLALAAHHYAHTASALTVLFSSHGSLVGTSISIAFLLLLGSMNAGVLRGLLRARKKRAVLGDTTPPGTSGPMFRIFRRLFSSLSHAWNLYPIGVLFGLGFDTTTEVLLLASAAGAAASNVPWYAIASLPLLFTAGMCLLDTADGIFMSRAYRSVASSHARTLHLNIAITSLSILIAFGIGLLEAAALITAALHLHGSIWHAVESTNFFVLGAGIVAAFIAVVAVGCLIRRNSPIARTASP